MRTSVKHNPGSRRVRVHGQGCGVSTPRPAPARPRPRPRAGSAGLGSSPSRPAHTGPSRGPVRALGAPLLPPKCPFCSQGPKSVSRGDTSLRLQPYLLPSPGIPRPAWPVIRDEVRHRRQAGAGGDPYSRACTHTHLHMHSHTLTSSSIPPATGSRGWDGLEPQRLGRVSRGPSKGCSHPSGLPQLLSLFQPLSEGPGLLLRVHCPDRGPEGRCSSHSVKLNWVGATRSRGPSGPLPGGCDGPDCGACPRPLIPASELKGALPHLSVKPGSAEYPPHPAPTPTCTHLSSPAPASASSFPNLPSQVYSVPEAKPVVLGSRMELSAPREGGG